MKIYPKKIKQNKTVVLFFILAILISVELLITHLRVNEIITIPCIFHVITDKYCPGCGMTRMILSLFKLEFYQAFRYNMLGFVLTPFALFYIFHTIVLWSGNGENNLIKKIPNKVWYSLIVVTFLFGILRNIEYFRFLAPTIISK